MPAGEGDDIRAINSKSGKLVVTALLSRCYDDGKPVDLRHVPALLLISAPGALCAWGGSVPGYARAGFG